MLLTRAGRYKNHGSKILFGEPTDLAQISTDKDEDGTFVEIAVIAPGKSTYDYKLRLTPEEVAYCFLSLPAIALEKAVRQISDRYDLSGCVPVRVAHLARSVMPEETNESNNGVRSRASYPGHVELTCSKPSRQPSA